MSYPPGRSRRRKARRRLAFALAGLAVIVAAGGFAYWPGSRFAARSEHLAGTPVELRIQAGVPARDLRAIRTGIRAEHSYLARALQRTVQGPVEARVSRASGCPALHESGGAPVGVARQGFLCIDTSLLGWQWLALKDRTAATATAAHEYVHVLQGEIGCLTDRDGSHYRWIVEGMASELGWRALVTTGQATEARVERTLRSDGAWDTHLEPLANYETADGRDREYALWQLAVRWLLDQAVATGAAGAARPETALARFCERVGRGRSWTRAFRNSFGLPVSEFYTRFEAARLQGVIAGRLPPAS